MPLVVERSVAPEEALSSFLSLEDCGSAMIRSRWSVQKEWDLLTAIAEGLVEGATVRDRMAAAERLRRNAIMTLRFNGRITDTKRVVRGSAEIDGRSVDLMEVQRTAQLLRDAHRDVLSSEGTGWLLPHETVSEVAEAARQKELILEEVSERHADERNTSGS